MAVLKKNLHFLVIFWIIGLCIPNSIGAFPHPFYRTLATTRLAAGESSSTSPSAATSSADNNSEELVDDSTGMKEYAPSQVRVDETTGEKWRLCAGAAVLNSQDQLLVGERIRRGGGDGTNNNNNKHSGEWQCPQGGVDDAWTPKGESSSPQPPTRRPKESIIEACHRELFEEMGLKVGTHVMVDSIYSEVSQAGVRYRTTGSDNWLTRAGFAGQELHWTIYRCIDGRGDKDPVTMCDLSGNGGEDAEFAAVEWQEIDDVVARIWEGKRAPYTALKSLVADGQQTQNAWEGQIAALNLSGTWARDNDLCTGVCDALLQRGLSKEAAKTEATKPYIQSWKPITGDPSGWIVTTLDVDGTTVRRELEYRVGEWEEEYKGNAVIFGESGNKGSTTTTLLRRTAYVAEPDAEPLAIAHVTVTDGPKGYEESRRYLKGDTMVLRRTLWPNGKGGKQPVVCTEIFTRTNE